MKNLGSSCPTIVPLFLSRVSSLVSLRHLSIPSFPAAFGFSGQMANASGTCSPAFSAFSTTDGTSIADGEMPFCFEHDSPDHRDEDEMMPVETHSEADFGGMQQAHYDSYNGGFWEDDAMAGRYVGDGGDQYAARLEGVMGHA